jgi:hypothetical protein
VLHKRSTRELGKESEMAQSKQPNRRSVRVQGVRRKPADLKKLSRALIALAMAQAQAEADAQAEDAKRRVEEESSRAA